MMKHYFIFLLTLLFSYSSVQAQSRLEGSVSSKNGTAILTASLKMHHQSNTALSKKIKFDEDYFIAENIADGSYKLVFTSKNYTTVILHNFQFPRDTDQILGIIMSEKKAKPVLNTDKVSSDVLVGSE